MGILYYLSSVIRHQFLTTRHLFPSANYLCVYDNQHTYPLGAEL